MNQSEPDSILPFKDQLNMAERELSAFFAAVDTLFGPEQAKLSAEDWLDATEQMFGSYEPTGRDWPARPARDDDSQAFEGGAARAESSETVDRPRDGPAAKPANDRAPQRQTFPNPNANGRAAQAAAR